MVVTEPGGGAHSDGQVSDEAPGGPAAVETQCPQQGSGELGQISDVDVRQRYGALLAGRLPTARGSEELVGKGVGPGIDPASLQIRVEGRRPVSTSSEGVGSFGSGGSWDVAHREVTSAIDLKLNAEVVISGRAQPGQTVQVNGRWLKVCADGTFSMRVALPVVKDDTEGRKK
jgi:hypothetical protein